MKPYLKGFNLSLETWREGRDKDGWKVVQPKKAQDGSQGEEKEDYEERQEEMENVEHEDRVGCSSHDERQRLRNRTSSRDHKGCAQIQRRPGGNLGASRMRQTCNEVCVKQPHAHGLLRVW